MLFWVDAEAAQNARGHPELGDITVTQADGPWRLMGSAIATEKPWGDFLASVSPGLTRCGGSMSGSRDRRGGTTWHKVCLTWTTASPEVALVRLRDQDGNVRDRRPGRHGFVLLGVTPENPLTRAYGIGHDGAELPGESITLWCAPYDTRMRADEHSAALGRRPISSRETAQSIEDRLSHGRRETAARAGGCGSFPAACERGPVSALCGTGTSVGLMPVLSATRLLGNDRVGLFHARVRESNGSWWWC